jgi:2-keto-3-deoxy-L-rhamnonate aldolase RhmA
MNRWLMSMLAAVALGAVPASAETPPPSPATPPSRLASTPPSPPSAPPPSFPLAAPAGKDGNARKVAPPGAVNKGPFDPTTWKYGGQWSAPAGTKIWNPVKLKMQQGATIVAGTVYNSTDPAIYCAMANAGYDFIWTEMQHSARGWDSIARMWRTCPHAKAVPGVRVAYTDEREIQHALDAGALVIIVPTVDSVAEAIEARNWTFFPPLGRRSNAVTVPATDPAMWGGVPGGYRATINDNVVLIEMIETLEGLRDADQIAKVPGLTALFAAGNDLGNFSGFRPETPDYERAINIVHDAGVKAGVRLCGPLTWRGRPDFTCFQAGSETEAITRGAALELGSLANTQAVPLVGPYAR